MRLKRVKKKKKKKKRPQKVKDPVQGVIDKSKGDIRPLQKWKSVPYTKNDSVLTVLVAKTT